MSASTSSASAGSTCTTADILGSMGVPDFFIVGHQKCGTTALYEMLRGHPQIFMPDVKEPRFFAPDLRSRLRPDDRSVRPTAARPTRSRTTSRCSPLRAPDQLAGEASPQYLRSHAAAGAIAEVQPQARIIAILREPASFLRSFHLQFLTPIRRPRRDFAGRSAWKRRGAKASRYRAAATSPASSPTPSTSATSSSCGASSRPSDASRCWC